MLKVDIRSHQKPTLPIIVVEGGVGARGTAIRPAKPIYIYKMTYVLNYPLPVRALILRLTAVNFGRCLLDSSVSQIILAALKSRPLAGRQRRGGARPCVTGRSAWLSSPSHHPKSCSSGDLRDNSAHYTNGVARARGHQCVKADWLCNHGIYSDATLWCVYGTTTLLKCQ